MWTFKRPFERTCLCVTLFVYVPHVPSNFVWSMSGQKPPTIRGPTCFKVRWPEVEGGSSDVLFSYITVNCHCLAESPRPSACFRVRRPKIEGGKSDLILFVQLYHCQLPYWERRNPKMGEESNKWSNVCHNLSKIISKKILFFFKGWKTAKTWLKWEESNKWSNASYRLSEISPQKIWGFRRAVKGYKWA